MTYRTFLEERNSDVKEKREAVSTNQKEAIELLEKYQRNYEALYPISEQYQRRLKETKKRFQKEKNIVDSINSQMEELRRKRQMHFNKEKRLYQKEENLQLNHDKLL